MGERRRSEFEDAHDIVPVEGLVLIEDLVDRHPVGEILEQNLDRNAGARARKPNPKMRQAQLSLAIVSKGRFDKSEPTIHKGEDLDIPAYRRRGVALNGMSVSADVRRRILVLFKPVRSERSSPFQ